MVLQTKLPCSGLCTPRGGSGFAMNRLCRGRYEDFFKICQGIHILLSGGGNDKTASSPPLLQSSYSTVSSWEMLCRAITPLHSFCHNAVKSNTHFCTGAAQGTLVAR